MSEPAQLPENQELFAVGGDLDPSTLLYAYSHGFFPMDEAESQSGERRPLSWWSPNPRGVLWPHRVHVSRSLRRSMARFEVTFDAAFADVLAACADPQRPAGWISGRMAQAYGRLHELGYAHSVEVWAGGDGPGRHLAGGLFCVEVGGLVAAESKFHHVTDASKAAVVALCRRLDAAGGRRLVDVQWSTEHLARLGVETMPRAHYLEQLRSLVRQAPALGQRI